MCIAFWHFNSSLSPQSFKAMIKVLIDIDFRFGKKPTRFSEAVNPFNVHSSAYSFCFLVFIQVSFKVSSSCAEGCIKDVAMLKRDREWAKREVEFCVFALRKTFAEVRDGKDFLINPQMSPLSLSLHFRLFYCSFYGVNLKDMKRKQALLNKTKQMYTFC